jgi:hypothetical protein
MQSDSEEVAHLERLQVELTRNGLNAQLISKRNRRPYLKVANQDIPNLNERVFCWSAGELTFCFWWPWSQPIGSVDDLGTVVGKVAAVLRSVEERS